MSGHHQAVARAIAAAMYATDAEEQVEVRAAAAAAIRVVLTEAQQAVEALIEAHDERGWRRGELIVRQTALAEALAAIAALAEDTP